jgi:hypothetical protein
MRGGVIHAGGNCFDIPSRQLQNGVEVYIKVMTTRLVTIATMFRWAAWKGGDGWEDCTSVQLCKVFGVFDRASVRTKN